MPEFDVISEITNVEVIARRPGIHSLSRLNRLYGRGKWRKLKGDALIRLRSGRVRMAELHWYEAHGIGKREMKRKRYLE
ncbi:MAG: hypothetical protein R3F37_07335 [Candidatus Competibacteraceae bacterium]